MRSRVPDDLGEDLGVHESPIEEGGMRRHGREIKDVKPLSITIYVTTPGNSELAVEEDMSFFELRMCLQRVTRTSITIARCQ